MIEKAKSLYRMKELANHEVNLDSHLKINSGPCSLKKKKKKKKYYQYSVG